MKKIFNFIKALCFHIGAGMPKASKKQILHRFDICIRCTSFHKNQCLECGCNINNKQIFMNKLAWADQKCPLDKW
jgi:hypothetical protein